MRHAGCDFCRISPPLLQCFYCKALDSQGECPPCQNSHRVLTPFKQVPVRLASIV